VGGWKAGARATLLDGSFDILVFILKEKNGMQAVMELYQKRSGSAGTAGISWWAPPPPRSALPELRAYRGGHRRPRDLPRLRPSPGLLWGSRGELLSTCKGFHFSKVSLEKRKLFLPWKPCKYSNMSAVQGAVLLCRQRRYVGQYFMQRTVLKKYIRLKMG